MRFEYLKKFKGCPNSSTLWPQTRNFLLEVESKLISQTRGLDHCEQIFTNAINALEAGNKALALEILEAGYLELKQITFIQG